MRGKPQLGEAIMSSRNVFASILVSCSLAVGVSGIASVANAESLPSDRNSSLKAGKSAKNKFIQTRRRFRSVRIHLPVGPSSVYYDYPYYYSRGHYPTHIGGYVYYPYYYYRHPYYHYRERVRRH
jgi:hypothetical protein